MLIQANQADSTAIVHVTAVYSAAYSPLQAGLHHYVCYLDEHACPVK